MGSGQIRIARWQTDYGKHPVYIRKAFEMARKHTKAKLELRDYGIEFWDGSRKSKAFYQLVKHLLNTGVPLDAVDSQGHFRTDNTYDWAKLKAAVVEYKKLGLEVYLTELDYGDADPIAAATSAHRNANFDSTQSRQYRQMAAAAVGGGMNWMCFWGVADNTNSYWRMGRARCCSTSSIAPSPLMKPSARASWTGSRSLSSNRPQAQSVRRGLSLVDGILHTGDVSVGEVEIRSLAGTPEARLELRDGAGRIPASLSMRCAMYTHVLLGLVTIW